jgi:hypothetical protein
MSAQNRPRQRVGHVLRLNSAGPPAVSLSTDVKIRRNGMPTDGFIATSIEENPGGQSHSLAVTRVVAGAPDAVRSRLADALERLGFHVLEEQPLMARRKVHGWGASCMTNKVLEVPTTLLVRLKASGEHATELTFNYTIKAPMLTRGDKRIVEREVDAAVALVASRHSDTCALCGTAAAEDSRFCRRCGAPLASYEPAELETLRIAAGSYAAYATIAQGAAVAGFGLLLLLLASFIPGFDVKNPAKLALVTSWIGWIFTGMGLVSTAVGTLGLRRALAPGERERERETGTPRHAALPASRTGALPAPPEYVSVTEHTTELLDPLPEPVPLRPRRRTGDVG